MKAETPFVIPPSSATLQDLRQTSRPARKKSAASSFAKQSTLESVWRT